MAYNCNPIMDWNPETGIATCTITIKGNTFCGVAKCCEEDRDMMSEKTGYAIAYTRARIKYYLHVRDNEIKPALKALRHLYNNISCGSNFNPKSHENVLLRRSIHLKEIELDTIKDLLDSEKQDLNTLLKEKDLFYRRIRANRSAKADPVGQN